MNSGDQFFGMVKNGEFNIFAPQHLEGETVRLTEMSATDSRPPESEQINLEKFEGKIIEVSGIDQGDWIYSARVVEEAGPVLSDFLRKVFCKSELLEKQCALIIGHKKDSPGAFNLKENISEFEFNETLASMIEKKVNGTKIQRIYRRTYATLPGDVNSLKPDFAISLHCNYHKGMESGTQVLYYHKSPRGKNMGEILYKHLVDYLKLPEIGCRPVTSEDKGGYLLCYSEVPIVIAEPFFIDNDVDLKRVMLNMEGLAEAYALAIDEISKVFKAETLADSISL